MRSISRLGLAVTFLPLVCHDVAYLRGKALIPEPSGQLRNLHIVALEENSSS